MFRWLRTICVPAIWLTGILLFSGLGTSINAQSGQGESLPAPGAPDKPPPVKDPARELARAKAKAEMDQEEADATGEGGLGIDSQLSAIPEGKPSTGVRIPNLEEGTLRSLVTAGKVTRVAQDFDMEDMKIEFFNDSGYVDLTIDMKTAALNVPTGLLQSQTPARLQNEQTDLTGDQLIYDTKTRKGKLVGNVKMRIYRTETSNEATPSPTETEG